MDSDHIKFEEFNFNRSQHFSMRDIAYANFDSRLEKYLSAYPKLENFSSIVDGKSKHFVNRELLVNVIKDQYQSYRVKAPKSVQELLDKNTFVVTTAHQASILLGPAYYVYKIVSAIALAKKLSSSLEGKKILPVFVLGAEDHDYEEIKSVHILNKTFTWETKQSGSTGAMLLENIQDLINQIKNILPENSYTEVLKKLFDKHFKPTYTLARATAGFVADLFKPYDVIVVNLNHPKLKESFISFIKKEIFENTSIKEITPTITEIEKDGFGQQAFVRDINFFYLGTGYRSRITKENGRFSVVDQNISWTEDEMLKEIENAPHRFSPNVVMRPIYQEHCLPNLAYVGGGGELAYWQERKKQFKAFDLPFPILVRRDSAWWIDYKVQKKYKKLGLEVSDLLNNIHDIQRIVAERNSGIDPSLKNIQEKVEKQFEQVQQTALTINPSLQKHIAAQQTHTLNALKKIEKKLVRQLKKKQIDNLEILALITDSIYPKGKLQERKASFFDIFSKFGYASIDELLLHFDPLKMTYKVFIEQKG